MVIRTVKPVYQSVRKKLFQNCYVWKLIEDAKRSYLKLIYKTMLGFGKGCDPFLKKERITEEKFTRLENGLGQFLVK